MRLCVATLFAVARRSRSPSVLGGMATLLTSLSLFGVSFTSASSSPSSSSSVLALHAQDFERDVFAAQCGAVAVRGAVWQIPHDEKRHKGGEARPHSATLLLASLTSLCPRVGHVRLVA